MQLRKFEGMKVGIKSRNNTLIADPQEGNLLGHWNSQHADRSDLCVEAFDRVVTVNGIWQSAQLMMDELKRAEVLQITLRRREPEKLPKRCTSVFMGSRSLAQSVALSSIRSSQAGSAGSADNDGEETADNTSNSPPEGGLSLWPWCSCSKSAAVAAAAADAASECSTQRPEPCVDWTRKAAGRCGAVSGVAPPRPSWSPMSYETSGS